MTNETTDRIKVYKFLMLFFCLVILLNPIFVLLIFNSFYASLATVFFISFSSLLIYRYGIYNWVSILMICIIFIVGVALSAELIFKNLFPELLVKNLYEERGNFYFNKPNLSELVNDDEFQTIYITNENGCRVPHFGYELKEPDWLFVGDSYTQGAQVNFSELFSSIIGSLNVTKNVLNIGVSGFSLYEEKEIINEFTRSSKPDIVFLQLCVLNDFEIIEKKEFDLSNFFVQHSDFYRFYYYNAIENENELKLKGRWVLPFYHDDIDNINYNVLDTRKSELKTRIFNDVRFYLDEIYNILKMRGVELVVILIPTKEQVYSEKYEEVREEISAELFKEWSDKVFFESLTQLRKNSKIEINYSLVEELLIQ